MHALHNTTRQRLAGLLVVTLAGALSDVTLAQPLPLYGQVVRVVDGDTVVLQDAYGTRHTLRLGELMRRKSACTPAKRHDSNWTPLWGGSM